MGRSNNTTLVNPAVRFFEWSPARGEFWYYDKETKTNVTVNLPFTFMVLEDMAAVGGGIKRNGKFERFWSNEVRSTETKVRPFLVKSKQGTEAEGLYADLKGRKGLSYIKGLYIAFKNGNNSLQIGHIKLKGSAVGAWFEFLKTHKDIYAGGITIKGRSEVIHGANGDYYTPVLVVKTDISDESNEQAKALDREILQPYLNAYLSKSVHAEVEQEYSGQPTGGGQFYDNEPEMAPEHGDAYEPPDDTIGNGSWRREEGW